MTKPSPDDDANARSNPQAAPGRAPQGLERLATGCLKEKAEDSRLGDLSEQYVRTHERVRAYLGNTRLALMFSHLAADVRYLFSAANVMLFARAADPVPQVAVASAKQTIALDAKEKTMTMLHTSARKLVLPALLLVGSAFLINGAVNAWNTWRETETLLVDLQREKAAAAAARIDQFVASVQRQVTWTSLPQVGASINPLEARRFDYVKLLRQAKEITEATYIDAEGRAQVTVSRLRMDQLASGTDLSADPRFQVASQGQTYFGPVYFRKNTEPYMAMAVPAGRPRGSVTAVDVNLKFMWEVIQRIRVGETGFAYVVDREGRLIAHPDIALVLQKTDLSSLPQVKAALPREGAAASKLAPLGEPRDPAGNAVQTASARIEPLGWTVFVELPIAEAQAPLWTALVRVASLLALGVLAIFLASVVAARRGVPAQPVQT
ncbi:MAG TPA: cache domain-containing protein [Burkholderiales bacterium]|nr:cache domain-containing protein [Burkholderiales bacterium]